jgi:pimeloyl-ACP methyl ester carboxylesterase
METKSFNNSGVNISYLKSGQGKPFILLHGNGESNKIFTDICDMLVKDFAVYAPDTRSHGKSSKVKRLNYDDIADDIKALIDHEKMENPILFGFSDGGIVGLLLAIKYPKLLEKLFVAGINLTPQGVKPLWRFLMRLVYCFTLSDKMRLMIEQPDIMAEQLKTIETPTTIFYAEKDIVKLSHSQIANENIKKSKLVFVPKENHGSYVLDNKKLYNHIMENM